MDLQKADINDYAMPLMQIERMAKQIHSLCLEYKYEEARLLTQQLCAEGRLLQHVLYIMQEGEANAHSQRVQDQQQALHR
jgi:hypothetical protein